MKVTRWDTSRCSEGRSAWRALRLRAQKYGDTGIGDPRTGQRRGQAQNLIGNVQLARHPIPALGGTRVLRIWLGLQSETADAMPMGPLPGLDEAYSIGCVHSGYTSVPSMGWLLAERILGREPAMPLFDPARLVCAPTIPREVLT